MAETIKVGSRKSNLAKAQTHHVIKELQVHYPDKEFNMVTMDTTGDKNLAQSLPEIGGKGVFTQELETALLSESIAFVVHSLKDLPTTLPEDMAIAAVCKREDPRDVAIFNKAFIGKTLSTLPPGSVIGTSSPRRIAQLARKYPDLKHQVVRGNLNTRLGKLENSVHEEIPNTLENPTIKEEVQYAGLLLASAGMKRMGWEDKISQYLHKDEMLYCVGQGALAVECLLKKDDHQESSNNKQLKVWELLEPLSDRKTTLCAIAERSFLRSLGGGCSAPVGVYSGITDENGEEVISLKGGVYSMNGKEALEEEITNRLHPSEDTNEPPNKMPHLAEKPKKLFCGILPASAAVDDCLIAQKLGEDLASKLVAQGALEIMEAARLVNEKNKGAKAKA